MHVTREQGYQTLAALGPAPVFLQSYERKRLPENLDIYFGPPESFFLATDIQDAYLKGRLIPVLDDGNVGIVTFFDPEQHSLVQIDLESPDEVVATFRCWQQYLAHLLVARVAESGVDDKQLRRMAELVQFRYIEDLFAFLCDFRQRAEHLPYPEFREELNRFISSIGDPTV